MKKVKKTEKYGRENPFLPVKKSKKSPKKGFHARDCFHAQKKKHWLGVLVRVALSVLVRFPLV